MKILHVIATLDGHGAERQMAALAGECRRRGCDVSVAALTRSGPVAKMLDQAGVRHWCLKKRSKLGVVAFMRLRKLLRRREPDVLHTWLFTGNTYGRLASVGLGIPAVVASERSVDRWRGPVHRAFDRSLLFVTDLIIANAEAVRQFYIDFEGVPGDRIVVAPNAIDVDRFGRMSREEARSRLGLPRDAWIVLTIGRLEPQKAVDRLIGAAARLKDMTPRPFLCVVGDGPLRAPLETLARKSLPEDSFLFAGYQDDVAPWLAACDVFALSSLWEGMPNVVLEAMAARRPVVATAVDGTAELIDHGETGWLAPPGDEERLAQTLHEVREMGADVRPIVDAAFEHVRENFSIAKTTDMTLGLYEKILQTKQRGDASSFQ